MREIKFRWFHKKSGRMTAWETVIKECDRLSFLFPSADWVVMQYTGLKDKNGKEIYEGDIVKHNDYSRGACITFEQHQSISVIEWSEGAIPYKIKGLGFDYYGKDLEIIGNIYENPELLKGEK